MRNSTALPGLAFVALMWGCGASEEAPNPSAEKPLAVEAILLGQSEVPLVVTAVGSTQPYARATPGTRLLGRVLSAAFEEGDLVQQGQEMVRIEVRDLSAKKRQAGAGLDEATAVLVSAEKNLRRMENLFAQAAITQQKLDESVTGYKRAAAAVATAEQAIEEIGVNLEDGAIKAPLTGVVVRKFVQAGDMAAPGAPLFTVEQQDSIKVVVQISERHQGLVEPGAMVRVEIEALGLEPSSLAARVEALVPAADAGSRSFQVKMLLANEGGAIKTGMFARVYFAKGRRPALLVPAAAIVQYGQLKGVYVVRQGQARLRWVRLGKTWAKGLEVLSGLESGDQIIITGLEKVRDGQPVEVEKHG